MRKLIPVILLLTGSAGLLHGQFPVHTDSVYTFMKYNSIHRSTVNWAAADKKFYSCLQQAATLHDTMRCYVGVLESLNDVHSQLYLNNRNYSYYYTSIADTSLVKRIRELNRLSGINANRIYTRLLPHGTGYIRVPSIQAYDTGQVNRYARALYDSVRQCSRQGARRFIIDLRLNGGGNLYPMLAGLSALLGSTTVGYETDENGTVVREWKIKNPNFIAGGYAATRLDEQAAIHLEKSPVVVLTGPATLSSGSMTAIAFKGRPNTIFIGEATAGGYTTSNNFFQFAPNLVLNFATNFVADRNKNLYKTVVPPGREVKAADNFDDLLKDEKVIQALNWLKKRK